MYLLFGLKSHTTLRKRLIPLTQTRNANWMYLPPSKGQRILNADLQ